ncbi:hypothetical protein OHA18_20095 [Kribbella sp. NBC_00709]|uniref:hypothetical protein n=1 Tax=Kribbella sp. NBC_00709 TaxID=2975972 RepID=UPI002E2C922B|nr:hypothetical protein [Kribbella sp. NBC_00709]
MTNQLKNLMTEAADAQAPYVPDVDSLLQTGRRQVRRRRVTAAIATAAAVAVVAGATTIAVGTINGSEAPVAPALMPTRTPLRTPLSVPSGGSTGLCTTADGSGSDGWLWPKVVLYAQDTFGMSMVRRSTTGGIAFCTTEWGNGARRSVVLGGAKNGIVLRKGAAEGRGALSGSSVTTVFGTVPRGTPPRVTVQTADGHVGVAKVKDGYFVYRRVEHSPWPGPAPRAIVRFKYAGKAEYVAASR